MNDKNTLFYENQKKVATHWLTVYIISLIVAFVGLLAYFFEKENVSIFEVLLIFGLSFIIFLVYLYIRVKYVKMTRKELEAVVLFKKRVYKLETLKRYECKKSHAKGYYYFIMYFDKTVCVVSVLDREKFTDLLNAVIEKNNTNAKGDGSDL